MEHAIIHCVRTEEPAVAFTFDDGPDPNYTPQLLDIFREAGGKATFFMVGTQIAAHPDIARAVHAAGHEIGNHTYHHPFLTRIGADEREREFVQAAEEIERVVGVKPAVFRPPFFDYDDEVAALCGKMGYKSIGAMNMAASDWTMPGVDHIVTHSRGHLTGGSFLIFHDGFGDRTQTVEAVRILVNEAVSRGLRLVTASELLAL